LKGGEIQGERGEKEERENWVVNLKKSRDRCKDGGRGRDGARERKMKHGNK